MFSECISTQSISLAVSAIINTVSIGIDDIINYCSFRITLSVCVSV